VVQQGRSSRTTPADGGAENGSGGRHIFGKEVEDGGELGGQMGRYTPFCFVSEQAGPCASTLIWAC